MTRSGNGHLLSRTVVRLQSGLLLAALWLGIVVSAHAAPLRFASINLCTDQLLLALAERLQIASITFLSRHAHSSSLAARATGFHLNHGQAEEMAAIAPDVVVASTYLSPAKQRFLRDLGFRVELFKLASSLEEVYANVRRMAALLGHPDRGNELVAQMLGRLGSVDSNHTGHPSPSGLIYEPNGYTGGRDTLRGDILHRAGWHNTATEGGISGVGVLDLETLLLLKPDRLILSPYAPGTHSLGQRLLEHPAVRKAVSDQPPVAIPIKHWICGGAMNVDAVEILMEARAKQ